MRRGFTKSTVEEVEEMRELHRRRWSLLAIGRKFGKDHTTIRYWLRKDLNYQPNPRGSIPLPPEKKKKEVKKEIEEVMKKDICVGCKNERIDGKWKKTAYCGIECWERVFMRRTHPVQFQYEHWEEGL